MDWSTEAQERLRRVPFFVRGMVSKKVEEFVGSQARSLVTEADLEAVKNQHLQARPSAADSREQSPSQGKGSTFSEFTDEEIRKIEEIAGRSERFAGHDTPFYSIRVCAGAFGCPQAVADVVALGERLRDEVEGSGLVEWIRKTVAGPLLPHHKFKIAVAGCPNACSEPQTKDFGLIAQVEPALEFPDLCDICGDCAAACREDAITVDGQPPVIDLSSLREVWSLRQSVRAGRTGGGKPRPAGNGGRETRPPSAPGNDDRRTGGRGTHRLPAACFLAFPNVECTRAAAIGRSHRTQRT